MTFPNANKFVGIYPNNRFGVLGVPETMLPDTTLPATPDARVFYVNGGSDGPTNNNSDGMTPFTPKRTIAAALALCVAGRNDIVVVLNYGGNARAVEVFPIALTKDFVHIVGLGNPAQKWPCVSVLAPGGADTARPAFLITGNRCEISGLEIGGGNTAACIYIGAVGGAAPWGTWIHDNWFGVSSDTVGQDGIGILAGADAPMTRIENNEFGPSVTRDGIRIAGNSTRGMIIGNIFKRMAGIAVNISGAAVQVAIQGNTMFLPSNTAGKGITLAAATAGCYVSHNYANFGPTEMANNPYDDGAAGGVNDWVYNWKSITATMPA